MYAAGTERDQVVQNAAAAEVQTILTIGTTPDDSRACLEIAHHYPGVLAAVGVHPHDVKDVPRSVLLEDLTRLAADSNVIAIGEIGLDYYRNLSPPDMQKDYFRQQLALAVDLRLPVIIHDRDAHQDVQHILENVDLSAVGGVLHCFSGDLAMAQWAVERGLLISIGGPVTYKKPGHLPEIVTALPLEALLIETDCPFLAPAPFRGKRNEPAYVRYVAEKIAEFRGISVNEVAAQTTANFERVFNTMG